MILSIVLTNLEGASKVSEIKERRFEVTEKPEYSSYRVTSESIREWGRGILCPTKEMARKYREREQRAKNLGEEIVRQFPDVLFLGDQFCCPYISIPREREDVLCGEIIEKFHVNLDNATMLTVDELLEMYW